jgi:fumarylacetoacetase
MSATALSELVTDGFGLDHLPYGSVSDGDGAPHLAVRIGDHAVLVRDLLDSEDPAELRDAADAPNLDRLLAAGEDAWTALRALLRDRVAHRSAPARAITDVVLHMPFTVADYVDFYASEHHASNVGKLFRPGQPALLPNWKHLPVGYHGRAGTIGIGSEIARPHGLRPEPDGVPSFGPSRRLDIELEVGFVLGGSAPEGRLNLDEAAGHVFGVVLMNDWSARDIQAYEYVPLGPNLGKSFATSIAPWITPLQALEAARVAPPSRDTPLSSYLDDEASAPWGLDLLLEVELNGEVVARPPFSSTYWTAPQMIAHMTVNGASLRPGDFIAGGTVSGPERGQRGSFLELSWGGEEPLRLADGSTRTFLEDGDRVVLRGVAVADGESHIRLAECDGRIIASA